MTLDPEAVIFDMDGLLIDTESHAKFAWQAAAREIGGEISDEVMLSLVGLHIDDCLVRVGEALNRDLKEVGFLEKVDQIYFSSFMRNGINVMKGADALLRELTGRGVPIAVATSSEKEIAPRKLLLADLAKYFDLIVTGCEVARSKPSPDIFLLTAERLGVSPEKCVVLEDSYNGVRAASAANMNPIMIPDLLPPTEEMNKLTIGIYDSLEEASPHLFGMFDRSIPR